MASQTPVTYLKGNENCAGTDGKGDHSHEGTHDKVWMKNLFLQRGRDGTPRFIITDTLKSKEKVQCEQWRVISFFTTELCSFSGRGSLISTGGSSGVRFSNSGNILDRTNDLKWVGEKKPTKIKKYNKKPREASLPIIIHHFWFWAPNEPWHVTVSFNQRLL